MRAGESFTVTGPAMFEVKHVAKSIATTSITNTPGSATVLSSSITTAAAIAATKSTAPVANPAEGGVLRGDVQLCI